MTPEVLYKRICKLHDDAEKLLDEASEPAPPTVARVACCVWLAAAATLLRNLRDLGIPADDEDDTLMHAGRWVQPKGGAS